MLVVCRILNGFLYAILARQALQSSNSTGKEAGSLAAPVRVPVSDVLAGSLPSFSPLAPGGSCPPQLGVSARGQLCLGLRLRRSRCITERKIPPDGGLGLLLFSQGAVPLARPTFNIKIRTILKRKSIF